MSSPPLSQVSFNAPASHTYASHFLSSLTIIYIIMTLLTFVKAEVRRSFITTTVREQRHTTRASPVGFELATNGIQFYAMPTWTRINELAINQTFAY